MLVRAKLGSAWSVVAAEKALMPWPHCDDGGQDYIVLDNVRASPNISEKLPGPTMAMFFPTFLSSLPPHRAQPISQLGAAFAIC